MGGIPICSAIAAHRHSPCSALQLVLCRLDQVTWLIPYEAFTVQVRATPEELVRRLRLQVAPQHGLSYWRRYQTGAFIQGRIRAIGFTFMEIPLPFVRGPRAVTHGRFLPHAERTTVRIRMSLLWPFWVLFGVLWYPLLIMACVVGFAGAGGNSATTADGLKSMLIVLSFALFPWLMFVPLFRPAAPAYRAELERLFAGK